MLDLNESCKLSLKGGVKGRLPWCWLCRKCGECLSNIRKYITGVVVVVETEGLIAWLVSVLKACGPCT